MIRARQAFGRYELHQRLSVGGMAEVFRATHLPTGTPVALKRLLPEVSEDEELMKMFEDEARIASSLEHPHIARCLDYGHVAGDWFIAYEFVHGKDMRAIFNASVKHGTPPPLPFTLHVFARIGEGLAYAHARKDASGAPVSIVHRDVSPMNIIVSYGGDVKLIDFGIAKAKGKLCRTQAGTIKGKFGYMAPEQVGGANVDHRADIFSMGICLWEMLTLERLFLADNEFVVIEKVRRMDVAPPSERACHRGLRVPPELDRIVLKALAKNPDERYRAGKDLFKDLNALASTLGAPATREQVARYMRQTFPESGGSDSGSADDKVDARMGTNDKDGGSDLDVFEGLGKKGASRPPPPTSRGVAPPAPPPPHAAGPMIAKRTLLGMNAPAAVVVPAPHGSSGVGPAGPPPSTRTPPPPPPGRGTLPAVVAPPQRGSTVPPPPTGARPPASAGPMAGVDMDWDDEDEATQIFDKEDAFPTVPPASSARSAPIPAAGTPPPAVLAKAKSTLLGLTAPTAAPFPPPPPSPSAAPGFSGSAPATQRPPAPPPSVGTAFARASSVPVGAAGPVAFPPPPAMHPVPPPPATQQGLGVPPPPPAPPMQPPPQMARPPSYAPPPRGPLPPPPAPGYGPPQGYGTPQPMRAMEATALVRPPQSRTGLWVAIALVALVLGGAAIFFLVPRTGRIVVNVADSGGATVNRCDIFVDGRKQCDTAPCIVEQVSAGAHEVKVLADGFDPQAQTVNVESRRDSTASMTLAGGAAKGGGVKVSGAQAGVKLYVDGKEIGPLPQEVRDLQPGDHAIKIAGSERYAPLDRRVTIEKDRVEDLGAVSLKVLKGKATISLNTPGARVYLVSGADRRELPMLPISVDIDTTKTWSLQASKAGYIDYTQAIGFDDGQAEKTYAVTLDVKTAASTAPATPPRPLTPTTPAAPPPAPPPAAGGGEPAFLNINSIPPSTCFLDGRPLGSTPKVHVQVSAGSHTVRFVNSEQGLTKTISVTVGAGETKPAVAKLN